VGQGTGARGFPGLECGSGGSENFFRTGWAGGAVASQVA